MQQKMEWTIKIYKLEFSAQLVRFGMKKYRVIARRPFRADVSISRYNEAIRNAGMSRASTKMCLCLQHFRQPTSYRGIATSGYALLAMTTYFFVQRNRPTAR